MRNKLLVFLVLIVSIISFAACDKKTADTKTASEKTTVSQQAKTSAETTKGEAATVLAKSGNAYSNSEKQKAVNDLKGEMDSLLNDINSMEDGNESYMTIE